MNPEQWLSLKWNGGSTMSDRWLNQSKIIQNQSEIYFLAAYYTQRVWDTSHIFKGFGDSRQQALFSVSDK